MPSVSLTFSRPSSRSHFKFLNGDKMGFGDVCWSRPLAHWSAGWSFNWFTNVPPGQKRCLVGGGVRSCSLRLINQSPGSRLAQDCSCLHGFFLPAVALRREDGSAAPLLTTVSVARAEVSLVSSLCFFCCIMTKQLITKNKTEITRGFGAREERQ